MAESGDLNEWEWLARLGPKLVARQPKIAYWRDYYEGRQDLPSGPTQHEDAFRRFQKLARTNLCLLCAESMVHRMQVVGYNSNRPGDRGTGDNPLWKLWQEARLDARQYTVYRRAFSRSEAYVIVGTNPNKPLKPRVTIEGPENVTVETDPADATKRLAALRMWHDSIAKKWMVTLYLPGERYHWQTVKDYKSCDDSLDLLRWEKTSWETRIEPARSFPEVPVIPFCNGDEGEEPRAEFAPGIDVQNRLNLTLLNRLSSERYAAFRQRFMVNYEPDYDELTGLPIAPYNPGTTTLWTAPPPEPGQPEIRFGDFSQTDTSQMLRGCEADMRAFAAVTLTPVYYLPGDMINVSVDAVAALDAGHIAKVRQRMALWGERWEEMLALMAWAADIPGDFSQGEVVWGRPENFNPAQTADYASKLVAAGFPLTMVAEEIGWSPQRVAQLRAEQAATTLLSGVTASASAPVPPANGTPGTLAPAAVEPAPNGTSIL